MIKPYLIIRAVSGALIVISGVMQAWNIYKTVTASKPMLAAAPAQAEAPPTDEVNEVTNSRVTVQVETIGSRLSTQGRGKHARAGGISFQDGRAHRLLGRARLSFHLSFLWS